LSIDRRAYELKLELAKGEIARLEAGIAKTHQSQKNDLEQLALIRRAVGLARKDYNRASELAKKNAAAETQKDKAEANLIKQQQQCTTLEKAIAIYPIQLKELEALLSSAKSKRDLAKLSLSKTVLRCPFEARVVGVSVEADQVVAAGQPVAVLADDSVLEISVPINSREFQRWFPLETGKAGGKDAWYARVPHVEVKVYWVESPEAHIWKGRLARVERLDPRSRMICIVAEVPLKLAGASHEGLMPLAEGMFCKVEMPGRWVRHVFRLPRSAVSYEGTVSLSENGRLRTRQVEVARFEGIEAWVASGLKEGDIVVTTRLVSPIEGMRLDVELSQP
jgi:multidrug efflux pump subunit AcrA (membrane-fusion protein)